LDEWPQPPPFSKDVIDLLKEKISLLTGQIETLEKHIETLETENANLKKKVADLDRIRPKDDLHVEAIKILQLLANQSGLRIEQIANFLGVSKTRAEYHRDVLKQLKMIRCPTFVTIGEETYQLSSGGREYLAKHGRI